MTRTRNICSSGLVLTFGILRKLQYFKEGGSEKHIGDIRGMIEVSGDAIDRAILDHWIPQLGVAVEWAAAVEDTPFA